MEGLRPVDAPHHGSRPCLNGASTCGPVSRAGATDADAQRLALDELCEADVGSAVRVIAAGAAIGLALSIMLGRLLTTMLFGVQPLDPLTFACVAALLVVTALASTAGPAWRAASVDPATALRGD